LKGRSFLLRLRETFILAMGGLSPASDTRIATMNLFVVIRKRGSAWQPSLPLEQQPDWDAHAAFMNALASEGFVVLGGPLEGTSDVLLIVRAASPKEITRRLEADPWTTQGFLRLSQITPWTLRLGSLP
jgi:uncharacterized protein YciI